MTKKVNLDAKSKLAKLMAFENLYVDHDPTQETASFDLVNRILTLPILKDMSGFVYNGFISHEVAHALWTPSEVKVHEEAIKSICPDEEVSKAFINITEDARIERMIEERYPGMRRDFYQFYEEFSEEKRDFFKLKGKNINKDFTLIDKINLKFKPGRYGFVDIDFTQEEQHYVDMVKNQKTFDDAVKSAKEIFDYMKMKGEITEVKTGTGQFKLGKGEEGDGEGFKIKVGDGKEAVGSTQGNFDSNFKGKLVDKANKDVNFGDAISSKDIPPESIIDKSVIEKLKLKNNQFDRDCQTFLMNITPTVNMMVSYFNMKKSAREYQKIQVSKTGKLNMDEISNYRIKDDIFLKNEYSPEEKNHGFLFFIDWSGSMQENIFASYKQMLILLEFCRKVNIPFEVYGFTSGNNNKQLKEKIPQNKIASDISNNVIFKMLASDMSSFDYKKNVSHIYKSLKTNPNNIYYMNSTPLENTALLSDIIVEQFRIKYKAEKNILVLLSDGEATDKINKNGKIAQETIMRNPLTGENFRVSNFHDIFKYVKEKNLMSKMVGFFLTNSLDERHMRILTGKEKCSEKTILKDKQKEFMERKYTFFNESPAFDKFFAVDMSNFAEVAAPKDLPNPEDADTKVKEEVLKNRINSTLQNMFFMRIFIEEIS